MERKFAGKMNNSSNIDVNIKKKARAEDLKGVIRKLEGLIEVAILVCCYYIVWKLCYRGDGIPFYYGNGKYVLALIYAFLIFVLFYLCDSFKYQK